jgi:hypothetical protein
MGQARRYAGKMNLAAMSPELKISETGYCLAQRGKEYLVFQPGSKGEFTVDLKDAPGTFRAEWLNINADRTVEEKPAKGGAVRSFRTPFPGPAALHLWRTD